MRRTHKAVTVIVQTHPARRGLIWPTLESIERSDISGHYTVLEQRPDVSHHEHFADVLHAMADCATPWVLRLEDDIVVGRHVLRDFLSWPALAHPKFGCGWLATPKAEMEADTARLDGHLIRNHREMYASYAVGCTPDFAAKVCEAHLKTDRSKDVDQDLQFARVAWDSGKRIFIHEPCLGENRLLPSIYGTRPDEATHNAHEYYAPGWCRPSFVITGLGRSGTGFMAKALNAVGVQCNHEKHWSLGSSHPATALATGESSWLAGPWLGELLPGVPVVHLVRHPRDVIAS
ncbi:MAG: hypothetical protein KC776_28845 [Myxococcales bacterium]|nr:hypothetical protein [Myxococcales bacterium]MCB9580966.1 hypothetical protein [Polyangiaceae bacterium]